MSSIIYDDYDVIVKQDDVEVQHYSNWGLKAPSHVLEDNEVMQNIESDFGIDSEDFDELDVGVFQAIASDGSNIVIEVYIV